jgi:hypothetical protein
MLYSILPVFVNTYLADIEKSICISKTSYVRIYHVSNILLTRRTRKQRKEEVRKAKRADGGVVSSKRLRTQVCGCSRTSGHSNGNAWVNREAFFDS